MYFNGLQTVEGQNYSFSASKGYKLLSDDEQGSYLAKRLVI